MSEYAKMLGDKWGVGAKAPHRGIVIAYGRKIRKVAIVTGTGLDRILPAAVCHNIVDQRMAEEFRKGDPYGALTTAIYSIAEHLGITLK